MRNFALVLVIGLFGVLAFSGLAQASQATNTTVVVGAHTSFDRTYNWLVTKTDDQHSSVTIAQNEVFSITYTITVSNATPAYTDSNWQVEDGIGIDNPGGFTLNDGPSDAAVSVVQDGGTTTTNGTASLCSTDNAYQNVVTTWPFGATHLACHYVLSLPDGSGGTVGATVTLGDGSTQSASKPFNFVTNLEPGQPSIKNGTVQVVDSQGGLLGTLTAPIHPQTFTYSVPVPSSACGSFDMPNTVNLLDPHTGANVGSATDTVHVTVTCPHTNGCTLTQGYWKTHSIYGPAAKPDPAWNLLPPFGPDSLFFLSGQTWIQVFNTSPSGGNVYYVLAHQYEAALLNQLNGASSTSAVDAALATATSFFNTYTPAQAGALSSNSSARQAANAAATTLGNYNTGLIGPGHCSENTVGS